MACQKVCKQGRDNAWKQRSTYWQSPMYSCFLSIATDSSAKSNSHSTSQNFIIIEQLSMRKSQNGAMAHGCTNNKWNVCMNRSLQDRAPTPHPYIFFTLYSWCNAAIILASLLSWHVGEGRWPGDEAKTMPCSLMIDTIISLQSTLTHCLSCWRGSV